MEKEGAIENNTKDDIHADLKALEGMKCKAPHKHQWGDTVYHNALITSILTTTADSYNDIKVKIIFINPTHEEMLPCPYLLSTDCKFSDEQCKYSHGEIVNFALLQEYSEPQFDILKVGCQVLAKQNNNLWYRGTVKKMLGDTCIVKFDTNNKELEVSLHETYPLNDTVISDEEEIEIDEEIINLSLLNPAVQGFGDWEKHTRVIDKLRKNLF